MMILLKSNISKLLYTVVRIFNSDRVKLPSSTILQFYTLPGDIQKCVSKCFYLC